MHEHPIQRVHQELLCFALTNYHEQARQYCQFVCCSVVNILAVSTERKRKQRRKISIENDWFLLEANGLADFPLKRVRSKYME